ncbi:MAG: hypothetical protein J0I47_15395 [Sphingomonas sp.]|uniref:hypothetical protein n=1 Tax=Sphingomonas sp. TaxID=28214 RepID=UPI001AD00609|nr:hypothetical protein [Sphingomonas sp.]MBN8809603.1 hypothetical protein [Sphingomonas sp.]
MFSLINDMGSLWGTSETALGLKTKIPFDGKLAENGLFVAIGDRKLTDDEFWDMCKAEAKVR